MLILLCRLPATALAAASGLGVEVDYPAVLHDPERGTGGLGQAQSPIRRPPQGTRDGGDMRVGRFSVIAHALLPLSIRSTLMKSGNPASFGRYSWAKVVFPVPFGPAMMTILGDSATFFMHAYYSPAAPRGTASPTTDYRLLLLNPRGTLINTDF